jgi:hypothetical protein
MVKATAGICRAHKWTAKSAIGHIEWSDQKPDPRGFDMADFRSDLTDCLALPAGVWSGEEEDDMALSADDKKWIEDAIKRLTPVAVLTTDGIIDNPVKDSPNTHISLETSVRNIETVARRTEAKVIGLGAPQVSDAQVAALAGAVASAVVADPKMSDLIAEKVASKLAARLAS